jgi:hypothetical protein
LIGSVFKRINVKAETLKDYLPAPHVTSLENAVYRFHNDLLAEPYPIQKKADVLPVHDPGVKKIMSVRLEWVKFLSKFNVECMTKKIKVGLQK